MVRKRQQYVLVGCLACVLFATVPVRAQQTVATGNPVNDFFVKTELYLWNRLADLLDIGRGGAALGPTAGLEIAITEYAQLGAYTSKEKGVSFPDLPFFWFVPKLEHRKIFRVHDGRYWTRVFGQNRVELNQGRTARFGRDPYEIRLQAGLGLIHLYYQLNLVEAGDFFAGIVNRDVLGDDEELDPTALRQPARQLGRGLSNVLTGLWEIPFNMHHVNQDDGGFAAITHGLVQGIWRCAARELVGAVEVVSFPMGWPPIIEPEFPFAPVRSTDWRVNRPAFMAKY